jgi:plastocyanin
MQRAFLTLFMFVLGLASCGGDGGGGGGGGEPVIELVKWTPSGDNQTDTVGQTLPNVIRVKVTADGDVVAGITVNFAGGSLGSPSVVTGANGIATTTWTLGAVAGQQSVTASVPGAVGSPVTFHATAVPAAPAALLYGGPSSGFIADTGAIFPGFAVMVTDSFGNGISGRWVKWGSTGPISLPTDSIITGDAGDATMFGKAKTTAGDISVTATVTGLTGSPRVFTGTVVSNSIQVTVSSNQFSPDSINIPAGSAVKWNFTSGSHSVSSINSPSFNGSDIQSSPSTWGPILFNTPGVYQYECSVHPSQMKGKVVVQ